MIELEVNSNNILKIYENLRTEDKLEIDFSIGKCCPDRFIELCLSSDKTYILGDLAKKPYAIGGLKECFIDSFPVGQVWLLCACDYGNYQKFLYKYVKAKILKFQKEYSFLFNYIYKTNFAAENWLTKFDFQFVELTKPDFKFFYFQKGDYKIDLRYFTCQ